MSCVPKRNPALSNAGSSSQSGASLTEVPIWDISTLVDNVVPFSTSVARRFSPPFGSTVIWILTPIAASPEFWDSLIQPVDVPPYSTLSVQATVDATSSDWLPPVARIIGWGTFRTGMVSSSGFWQAKRAARRTRAAKMRGNTFVFMVIQDSRKGARHNFQPRASLRTCFTASLIRRSPSAC